MSWLDANGDLCDYPNSRWSTYEQTLPDPSKPGEFVRALYSHRIGMSTLGHPRREMVRYSYVRINIRTKASTNQDIWCTSEQAFQALLVFWSNDLWHYKSAEKESTYPALRLIS